MDTQKYNLFCSGARILTVALVFWISPVRAEPVVVVTQDGTPVVSLTREEVADLFLGRRNITISGQDITPLDVNDYALRDTFYQGVTGMSAIRVNAYWARMVFSARGRPPRMASLSEIKRLVHGRSGLVTYLPANDANGFKIVLMVQ